MTPKDKAKELQHKYMSVRWDIGPDDAIQCALIAVDEILNDYSYMQNVRNANSNQIHSQRGYWQEVKQEIELI